MSDLHHTTETVVGDDELARRARLGDKEAFSTLVDRHGPVVHRFATRMVGAEDALDVTQDTFVTAWTSIERYRGESTVRTWLLGIAANHARHRQRWHARHPDAPLPEPGAAAEAGALTDGDPGPVRRAIDAAFRDALEAALAELPPQQRACWVLRDVEGLSYAEIAQIQGTTTTSVRGALHRARATLATRLEAWR